MLLYIVLEATGWGQRDKEEAMVTLSGVGVWG